MALAGLVERSPHAADKPQLYNLVAQVRMSTFLPDCAARKCRVAILPAPTQALQEPSTSWEPSLASAVLHLARSLAAICCHQQQPAGPMQRAAVYGGVLAPPPSSFEVSQQAAEELEAAAGAGAAAATDAGLELIRQCAYSDY